MLQKRRISVIFLGVKVPLNAPLAWRKIFNIQKLALEAV